MPVLRSPFAERRFMHLTSTVCSSTLIRGASPADIQSLGTTGLDGTDLLPHLSSSPVPNSNAILAMRNALMAQEKQTAWLVATGALTNVALLVGTFPEIVGHLKGLSIMGGAVGNNFTNAPLGHVKGEGERFGNHTPWAEFNVYVGYRKYLIHLVKRNLPR